MPATVVLLNEVRLLDVSYVSVLLIVVVAVGLHVVAVAVVGMSSTVFVHLSRFVLELNRTRVVLNFFVLDVVSFGLSSGFMVMVLVSGSGLGASWITMTVGVVVVVVAADVVVVNNGLTTSILIEFISNKN